ncbi:transposase [Algoriphagus aquimarinus]|uniref:transposase n=1 Tax=Algoriphagus aquimarinus TaxID=237018 RepID=UPI0030DDC339|tara:strand:- start:5517 stop:6083 length:567 start_codon:yes stop_codon:yes gene_type:complete
MGHQDSKYRNSRNSRMEFDSVYFWTNTIKDWKCVLENNQYKEIIISSWRELVSRGMVVVYGFVIMPNHLHVIWEMKGPNGKEMPYASFNKYTSHMIINNLNSVSPNRLSEFKVDDNDRLFRIWQRDPLAILMDSKEKLEQKLTYLHNNPLQAHWILADSPENYRWSSAMFYEKGADDFGFITHYMDRF